MAHNRFVCGTKDPYARVEKNAVIKPGHGKEVLLFVLSYIKQITDRKR